VNNLGNKKELKSALKHASSLQAAGDLNSKDGKDNASQG